MVKKFSILLQMFALIAISIIGLMIALAKRVCAARTQSFLTAGEDIAALGTPLTEQAAFTICVKG